MNQRLLDHLVGDCQYARRDIEAERLGSLHVNDQLEFSRLLNRQISRFFTAEYSINIRRCASKQIGLESANPIFHYKLTSSRREALQFV
jgi:hypothetical protein